MYKNNAVNSWFIDRRRRKNNMFLSKISIDSDDHSLLHRGRKHFCNNCLHAFITEEILKCHTQDCFKIDGK